MQETIQRTSFIILAILGVTFLTLGIILIIISKKEKGKLKLFLMLTGISAIAPLIFTILHNLFYALSKINYLFEISNATS